MPTYDYICNACHQRFDIFLSYSEYGVKQVLCTNCGSAKVKRRPPRVRLLRSEESHMEGMADEFAGLEGAEDDPQALGRMMRKMGREIVHIKDGPGFLINRIWLMLANEADWLTGLDNTGYLTKYSIDSVTVSGTNATVVVTETWTDGVLTSTYGLVEQNGAVLLDSWETD